MNITVINGTEKHGVTYRLKEMFLADFSDNANITEYYLPKDCPNFYVGCLNCTLKGEKTCKDADTHVVPPSFSSLSPRLPSGSLKLLFVT